MYSVCDWIILSSLLKRSHAFTDPIINDFFINQFVKKTQKKLLLQRKKKLWIWNNMRVNVYDKIVILG